MKAAAADAAPSRRETPGSVDGGASPPVEAGERVGAPLPLPLPPPLPVRGDVPARSHTVEQLAGRSV